MLRDGQNARAFANITTGWAGCLFAVPFPNHDFKEVPFMCKNCKEFFVCIFMLCALLLLSGCTFDIQLSEELQKQIAENAEETDEVEANLWSSPTRRWTR